MSETIETITCPYCKINSAPAKFLEYNPEHVWILDKDLETILDNIGEGFEAYFPVTMTRLRAARRKVKS